MGSRCIAQGAQLGTLNDLDGGMGEGEIQGGDTGVHMAGSCCCIAQANTTL